MNGRALAKERALDLGLLFAAKAAIGAYVLSHGFSHVSDDDYARVVIAELFAHAPALDPSGTSWLPFPFWLNGAAMLVLGRSLATARAVAIALGVLSVAAPFLVLRSAGIGRRVALIGVGLAMATPWSAWLGVATVPEALTASLVAAGAFATMRERPSVWVGAGLCAAALSRYEAWPACAAFAAIAVWRARAHPEHRTRAMVTAALAAAGPIAWIAWNARAHGDPLHFLARVAAYRQSIGAAAIPFAQKLYAYPLALFDGAHEIAAIAAVGAFALADPKVRARWKGPLAVAAAIGAFLVYGDVRDGAPTHHPERALLGVWFILAAFGVDAVRALALRFAWHRPGREAWVVAIGTGALVGWSARLLSAWSSHPGREPDERRDAQVARGLELHDQDAAALDVVPCAFEHFAVLAAFGAPERATIANATHAPVTVACPHVVVR